jgi:uncharacterized protein (TIGR00251 family)
VRVQPGTSRERVGGTRAGALVVKLTAPPVDGQANAALARFLARLLGVAPSAVRLVRGAAAREKLVRVAGLRASEARARLAAREAPP